MKHTLTLLLALLLAVTAQAANDFSNATDCVAVWPFDSISSGEPNLTASASSEGGPAWEAFDQDVGTGSVWTTASGQEVPCWLAFEWGSGRGAVCDQYSIRSRYLQADQAPKDWTFEGHDGDDWTTLDTVTDETGWGGGGEARTFTFTNTTVYEKYRLSVSANNGDADYTSIVSLDLKNQDGSFLVPIMTANTHPTGEVADDKGSNTLVVTGDANEPVIETGDYQEGTGSIDLELTSQHQFGFLPHETASSDFPLKGGTTNRTFTFTMWFKPESLPNFYNVLWIATGSVYTSFTGAYVDNLGNAQFNWVGASTDDFLLLASPDLSVGQWYFIACAHDHSTTTARFYVYDPNTSTILYNSTKDTSSEGDLLCEYSPFEVGGDGDNKSGSLNQFDGLIDEVTAWKTYLSVDDINDIRDGTYASSGNPQIIRIFLSQAAPWGWIRQAAAFREPERFILGRGHNGESAFMDPGAVLQ